MTRPLITSMNDPAKWADDLAFVLTDNAALVREAPNHKAVLMALLTYVDDLRQVLGALPDLNESVLEPLHLIASEIDQFLAHRKSDVLKPSEGDKSAGLTIEDHALRTRAIQYVECYKAIGLSDSDAFGKVATIFKEYRGHKGQFGKATVKEWWHEAHKFGRFANHRAAVDETWNGLGDALKARSPTVHELDQDLAKIEAKWSNSK